MMKRLVLSMVGLSLCLLGNVGQVAALDFELSEDVKLDVDVELKYGAAWRMKDQDPELATVGNSNFDKNDAVANKFSVIADMDLQYKNMGIFVRPRAFFDYAYDDDKFGSSTKDVHRDEAEILDAFAYGYFDLGGGHNLDLRIGSHVLSWGESLYLQNGVASAMNPLDATVTKSPGVALKEIFLPVEQISATVDVTDTIALSGFYQWKYKKSVLNEQGAYFSDSDTLGGDSTRIAVDPLVDADIDRIVDREAEDDGQWGVGMRYRAEALNDTEFGLYFINYHDKFPMVVGDYTGGSYSPTAQAVIDGYGLDPINYSPFTDPYFADPIYPWYVGGFIPALPVNPDLPLSNSVVGGWGNTPVSTVLEGGVPVGVIPMGSPLADPATAGLLNVADLSSYHLEYAEDIKLLGFSFGTSIGDTNVGGEVTYRMDQPLMVAADNSKFVLVDVPGLGLVPAPGNILGFDYVRGNATQVQVSAMHSWGVTALWDQLFVLGELGWNRVSGYGNRTLMADKSAWGGEVKAELQYLQVLPALDMEVSVGYAFNPDGTSALTASFTEDADELSIGLDFVYNIDYRFGLEYVDFLGDPEDNELADRDYLAFNFRYTF